MVILISGASHSGKTALAQKLLEFYKYPYLSIDHLKMGLIRSGYTSLTPIDSIEDLTNYLWPVVREIIKTNIENNQNIIIEGCYIPFDFYKDFSKNYLDQIRHISIILSENYIKNNFNKITSYANVIESRLHDEVDMEEIVAENKLFLEQANKHNHKYVLVENEYNIDIEDILKK